VSLHLRAEQARLAAEAAYVAAQLARIEAEAAAFVRQVYGADVSRGFTLDSARGVIRAPDPAPDRAPDRASAAE
jgi:hypothetical protein